MATVTNNQQTYFTNDSKHRRTTYTVSTKMNSEINYIRYNILISKNRKMIEDAGLMKSEQLDYLDKKKDTLEYLSNNGIFYKSKIARADTNNTSPSFKMFKTGNSDAPFEAAEDSDRYAKQLKTMINMLYSMLPSEIKNHLYPYFITISDRNCSAGELMDKMRGRKSNKSSKLLDNFRVNIKTVLEFIRRHYPVLGGVSKTEITMNVDRLLHEIETYLWHQHQHFLLFTMTPIDTYQTYKGNHVNDFIFEEVEKVFGSKNVNKLAFDIKHVTAKDGNLGDAIDEVSKYAAKPEMFNDLDDVSQKDVEENRFNTFHLKAFAEYRGALYNLHLKQKFGLLESIGKFFNRLGRYKSAINAAMANNPSWNIAHRRTFGKVLTCEGLLVYARGKKERNHWKMINFKPMNDRDFLHANRNFISHVLMGPSQLNWLNNVIGNLDAKSLGVKDKYYDYALQYLNSIPFLHSVDDIVDWIKSVADKKMKEAKSYLYRIKKLDGEYYHTYLMKRNDANDMYRLIDCIKKYTDSHGVVKLGLHTNPDFKIKVHHWVQTYKGALSHLGFDVKRGWRYLGGLYNGQKDVVDEFTDEEQRICRKSMGIADKSLDYLEVSPQPKELICLDRVGCFLNCDSSKYKDKDLVPLNKDAYLDKDTGEVVSVIDSSNYDMLTAPAFDTYNYSKDGTGFDIDLFAKVNDFKTVRFDLERAMSSFIKSISSKYLSKPKAKKMANAL